MTRNSRLNSLSETKNKRLLFKVVKTNWTHNNRPFLDTKTVNDLVPDYLPEKFPSVNTIKKMV